MAKTKEQKQVIVDTLGTGLKAAPSAVFVGFKGITVADETTMRRDLRAEGVTYTVAKKTLIRRALDSLGFPAKEATLEGEVAVAYGKEGVDLTAPARLVHAFGTKWQGKLAILGGLFEGKLMGAEEMREIATIPAMPVLRGMFANVINSPIQGLVIALNGIAEKKQ